MQHSMLLYTMQSINLGEHNEYCYRYWHLQYSSCYKNKGVIISEPSVITYDTYTNSIIAVGDMAYKTIGKTPESKGYLSYG